jgi:hypothetical protein
MRVLRNLKKWNSEKIKTLRETPNTEDETRVRARLRKRAERMGYTIFPEPKGVTGGGTVPAGWKKEDIPEHNYKKHRYDRIPEELIGKPLISVVKDDRKGKPYVLAHELGHATGKNLRRSTGDGSTDSRLRRQFEEIRANIQGYKILKEEGADDQTLKNARKGFYRQTLNTILGKPR